MEPTKQCEQCGRHTRRTVEVPSERQIALILAKQPNAEIFVFDLCEGCAR